MVKKLLIANLIIASAFIWGVRPYSVGAQTSGLMDAKSAAMRAQRGSRDHADKVLKVLELEARARKDREKRDSDMCGKKEGDDMKRENADRKAKLDAIRKMHDQGTDPKAIVAKIKELREDRDGHDKNYRGAFIRCHLDKARGLIKTASERADRIQSKLNELRPANASDLQVMLDRAKASIADAQGKATRIEEIVNSGDLLNKEKVDEVKRLFDGIKTALKQAYEQFKAIAKAAEAK